MENKQLIWIIPLLLVIGYLFGLYIGIPNHIDITVDYGENVQSFTSVLNNSMNNIVMFCNNTIKNNFFTFKNTECTYIPEEQVYWCYKERG